MIDNAPMTDESTAANVRDHNRRLGAHDEELRFLREDVSDISKGISSIEATLTIFSNTLGTIANRPTPWGTIIVAASAVVSIFVLALTPMAWLAIENYGHAKAIDQKVSERGEIVGSLIARIEQIDTKQTRDEARLLDLERNRWTPADDHQAREDMRDELYRYIDQSREVKP